MTRVEIEEAAADCDLGRVVGPLDSLLDDEWETLHRFVEWASRDLRAERDRLAAEVERLREDAERLDYLIQQTGDGPCLVVWQQNYKDEPFTTLQACGSTNVTGHFNDVRAAIDAARAKG